MQSSRFTKEVQERAQYVDGQMYMSLPRHSTPHVLLMSLAQVGLQQHLKKNKLTKYFIQPKKYWIYFLNHVNIII